tara:strand:+ start:235 stop:435 length:201 start_codon:yes stop_codon:yes gene_type:complete
MDAYEEHYKPLEGFTILTYLGMSEEEYGDGFPQFLISNGKEDLVIEVSRDPEGNGGGFLFISGKDQ